MQNEPVPWMAFVMGWIMGGPFGFTVSQIIHIWWWQRGDE